MTRVTNECVGDTMRKGRSRSYPAERVKTPWGMPKGRRGDILGPNRFRILSARSRSNACIRQQRQEFELSARFFAVYDCFSQFTGQK